MFEAANKSYKNLCILFAESTSKRPNQTVDEMLHQEKRLSEILETNKILSYLMHIMTQTFGPIELGMF